MSGNRYASALARSRREYEQVVGEDVTLLSRYGLRLLSVEGGGVRAAVESELRGNKVNPWNVIEISPKTWNWIRPLLLRLSSHEGHVASEVLSVVLGSDRVTDSDHE